MVKKNLHENDIPIKLLQLCRIQPFNLKNRSINVAINCLLDDKENIIYNIDAKEGPKLQTTWENIKEAETMNIVHGDGKK